MDREARDKDKDKDEDTRSAESRRLALAVQRALTSGDSSHLDRGVKRAAFALLSGAEVPAVLTEIAFVSSATDEHKLQSPSGREKVAEAIYQGIVDYLSSAKRPQGSP